MPFHKRADKRLSDIQKGLIFAASAVLKIADELILAHNESRPPNLRKVIDHIVDSIILMGRVRKQISADSKEGLKPVLNKISQHYVTRKLQIQNIFFQRICWKA